MMMICDEKTLQLQLQELREDAGLSIKQATTGITRQYAIPAVDLSRWEQEQLPDLPVLLCLLDYYHTDDLNQFFGWKRAISPTAITIAELLDLGCKVSYAHSYGKPPAVRLDLKRKRNIKQKSIADLCLDLQEHGIQINEQEYESYEQGVLPNTITILHLCRSLEQDDLNDLFEYRMYPRLSDEALAVAKTLQVQGRNTQKELLSILRDVVSSHYYCQESHYSYALANNLRALRAETALTIDELANEIGVSARSVHQWEQGKTQPSVWGLLAYAETFDVSLDFLFSRERTTDNDFGL